MVYTMDMLLTVFPLVSCILFVASKLTRYRNLVVIALWLSLIAVILQYQASGGEILGSYFNYSRALIYSANLLIMLICLVDILLSYARLAKRNTLRYLITFLIAASIISILLLLGNLWINARFIETRKEGTPVLQVASFKKLEYCSYAYVFYKADMDGKISYMCPNYYGLLPSIGNLDSAPDYVTRQLPKPLKLKFLVKPQEAY